MRLSGRRKGTRGEHIEPLLRVRAFCEVSFVFALGACGQTRDSLQADAGGKCGHGTSFVGGTCEATGGSGGLRCGAGTVVRGGECVPASDAARPLACGNGTTGINGLCVRVPLGDAGSPVTCGPGTHEVAGTCIAEMDAGTQPGCGAGTVRVGDVCAALPPTEEGRGTVCGSGTQVVDGACVATRVEAGPSLICGPGTHEVRGLCLPISVDAGKSSICGTGTREVGGLCLPISADAGKGVACGAGTQDINGVCVLIPVDAGRPLECSSGLREVSGECRPLPNGDGGTHYEVRVTSTEQPADGYSLNSILVIGTNDDMTPALGPVVVTLSRSDAGTLSETNLTLSSMGASTVFKACNGFESPSCAGTFTIALALASKPNEIVATSLPVRLFIPGPVGDPAPCLVGGNVFYLDGDPADYIHPGTETITQASWYASYGESDVFIRAGNVTVWSARFSTVHINQTLTPRVYLNSETAGVEGDGHAGLSISGDARACDSTGDFQIQEVTQDSQGVLRSFTSTFEQRCSGSTGALRGCVHFEQ